MKCSMMKTKTLILQTYETDEGEYPENLNTQTVFTLRGVVLDRLLK